jgi:hypothetical protein
MRVDIISWNENGDFWDENGDLIVCLARGVKELNRELSEWN